MKHDIDASCGGCMVIHFEYATTADPTPTCRTCRRCRKAVHPSERDQDCTLPLLPNIGLESFGVVDGTDTARFRCGCSVRFFFRLLIGPAFAGHTSTDHRIATLCSRQHAIDLARVVTADGAAWYLDRPFDRLTFDVAP